MAGELFPCQRVKLSSPCVNPRELALTWIDKRESENWALISGNSLASEIHAWCAHEVLMRNNSRGTMKSNSLDGEFLRLLSGTHHVATSFSRAGLVKGEEFAWIVDLSGEASMDDFTKIAEKMSFQITGQRPNLEIFDHHRLGIEGEKSENAAIGHIHLADLR
ncbi:MAG: hypothetical protein VX366_06350 [Candidatus Thermoplasmatota archaeon]|nr:hypothetical protein [Candidatus Thermoplasmatota archaeon]